MEFFHTLIYQPILNVLIFLYNTVSFRDFGVAIAVTTIFLKFILIPISRKQIESQKKMQDLQPQIKELQNKYKDNKEKQTKELMEFYKKNKANPLSGCLPLVIQFVFLIAIYRVLFNISNAGLVVNSVELYSFITDPGQINKLFIGIIDLTKPNVVLALLAAVSQYFQTKMLMKTKQEEKAASTKKETNKKDQLDFASMMSKQMVYLGPFLTFFIGVKFPAGLALYWLVSTLFMLGQQAYISKKTVTS